LSELAGVHSVSADKDSRIAKITFDTPATEEQIKALLAEIDYPVAN
jgi:copper chaperone CopZ